MMNTLESTDVNEREELHSINRRQKKTINSTSAFLRRRRPDDRIPSETHRFSPSRWPKASLFCQSTYEVIR